MSQSTRRIPFRLLGTGTDVHLRYLAEDAELRPFLGLRPHDAAAVLQAAPVRARRLVPAAELSAAMVRYGERHGAPRAALDNAAALADGETCAVVTGQQPGLFGGPMYNVHKAATAIRLARELSALPGAPRVVPVFWNHTDDHDLDEANRAVVVNANLDLQRLRLDLPRSGAPLRDVAVARPMEQALAALQDLLPLTEFRDWALAPLQPVAADDTFGSIMARLLLHVFGEHGLVVIEPRDLPEVAFSALPRWCGQAESIRAVVRSGLEHLVDVGIDVTIDPTATLMFHTSGARRQPLSDGDTLPRATSLSPGVLLRPLWQDACIPTIASVVGPGELSYLAIAGPVYRHLGVPPPVFVPRASLTLVEPSQKKLLSRFGWDLPALAQGPTALARSLSSDGDNPIESDLDRLALSIKKQMGAIIEKVRKFDGQMVGPLDRARSKMADELGKLSGRLKRSRQNREGTGVRQIRRLCSYLRPRGRLQERVLTVLPSLVAHGPELATELIAAADPYALEHIVLEL